MTFLGEYMTANACPFCGLVTDVAHETQQGCIDALQEEIARVREILENSKPIDPPRPSCDADDRR
jgi:hypothetical protein